MRNKKVFIIGIIALLLYGTIFITDYTRCSSLKEPVFVIAKNVTVDEGSSGIYQGLGYTIEIEKYIDAKYGVCIRSVEMKVFGQVVSASIADTHISEKEVVSQKNEDTFKNESSSQIEKNTLSEEIIEKQNFINPTGMTVESRIKVPTGYHRTETENGTLQDFLRKYPVKEDGSPVLLYDGRKKGNQLAHAVVLELPIEKEDLQQCADSIMRIYAEYFYATKQYDRISFHFVNGFEASYTKWREGYRISFEGSDCKWIKSKEYDDSYETFIKYMRIVFAYAGTLSMENETEEISLSDAKAGNVFLMGGSPGHVVMLLDVCENEQGEKAFLLAQGYMPAQEFHILKNPAHENDPWYYENEITYPLRTPEYTFQEGSLKRLEY